MQNIDIKKKIKTKAKALFDKDGSFKTLEIERRPLNDYDVLIDVKYVGICHSDVHYARSEWNNEKYPLVPGHEIAGKVIAVGSKVSKFKVNDSIGVGCMVNSCQECDYCKNGYEQLCSQCIWTYGTKNVFDDNEITYGGYSQLFVVDEKFGIKIDNNAPLEYAAPLLCAGITTYAPIVFSNVKKGDNVAIAGFGGLGVMAAKYAIYFGANTYAISRKTNKNDEAAKLGIKKTFNDLNDIEERFDLIVSTIPSTYDLASYIRLLKIGGECAILGIPPKELNWSFNPTNLVHLQHRKVYGSLIGGIKLTQEMMDLSLKQKIYPEIEIISIDQLDEVYEKLSNNKAKFRYVIDMSTFKE